jgi:glycosyltransferase involved in cell wall biosynthesis
MTRRPRLVHVTTSDMSLVLLLGAQLQAFASAGYEVIGISAPGPYVDELRADGIAHCPLPAATRTFNPAADVRAFCDLARLLRRLRPDIVHTHNPKPGLYGRIAARRVGVPVVVNTVHGLYATEDDPWLKRHSVYAAERFATRFSDYELVQNAEDFERMATLGIPASKLGLLGNGIDLKRFDASAASEGRRTAVRTRLGISADQVVCGVVGRLVWEKGYREIFEVARRLRTTEPTLRVVVVGPDEPQKRDAVPESSKREARDHGVQFLGERRDMADLYCAFDLFVLASYREGVPRAAMEAAAMGLPIVATNVRGCRQIVDDGQTGLLVAARDVEALTRAVTELVADRNLRRRLGSAGREKAKREFDEARVIEFTLTIYGQLLGRHSAAA